MSKQHGRGGMGNHKHGVSGHSSPSPGYKQQRTREANQQLAEAAAKRPKPRVYATMAEAMAARRGNQP